MSCADFLKNGVLDNWWDVRRMFPDGSLKAWYGPHEAARIWQDINGVTAVAANNDLVGLELDLSQGLVVGDDIIGGGSFATGVTGWSANDGTLTAETTIVYESPGAAKMVASNATGRIFKAGTCVVGQLYLASAAVYSPTGNAGTPALRIGDAATLAERGQVSFGTTKDAWIVRSMYFVATATTHYLNISGIPNGATLYADSVTVKPVAGNHASQITAGSRSAWKSATRSLNFSSGTKSLVTVFPSSLGSDCTIGRAIPGSGASILTGQTIGTSHTETTDNAALVIVNRTLTGTETLRLERYLRRLSF